MNSSSEVNVTAVPIWLEIKVLHWYKNDEADYMEALNFLCVQETKNLFYKTNNKRNILSETYFKIKRR